MDITYLQLLANNYKWLIFFVFAIILFIVDFLGHKDKKGLEHELKMKSAINWSIFWVAAGLIFGLYVWVAEGSLSASRYYASYILEKGMSVDNIAVWFAILTTMAVKKESWHKLLTWGIVGAIIFRGIFIFGGINIIHKFEFLELVLGFFLLWGVIKIVGVKLSTKPLKISLASENDHFDPHKDKIVQFVKWILRKVNPKYNDVSAVFLVVLLTIEFTDIVFALDSIPVVIALNDSPFVAASSNLFAIFGLRALFFVVSDFLSKLEYLKYGLGATLLFIACKMIFGFHLNPVYGLIVITLILTTATLLSVWHKTKKERLKG